MMFDLKRGSPDANLHVEIVYDNLYIYIYIYVYIMYRYIKAEVCLVF